MKAKKPVKHSSKPSKPSGKKPAARKAAKSGKSSGLKAAASKLKSALLRKVSASANKSKPAKAKPMPAAAGKFISKLQEKTRSSIIAPKGMLTEAQVRRSSDREYMNEAQLAFFRHRLLQMRDEVLGRELDVKERLHQREVFADPADRATAEEEHWLDLRLRERESLLLRKIDEALRRIDAREFGYCEKTGDPIGIPRLLARPTATVCVDVKGQDERVEAQFRDR